MMRVMCVFGTRPEAIKMAPVVQALRRRPQQVELITCSTGQHREMLRQVLELFEIVPDIDLDLMQAEQTPTQVASRVLDGLDRVFRRHALDWLLLQGDTTTAMASAIAAHHARIRVGHVEAGLRSGDRWNPFPEETNRLIVDHVSELCFAPTERARLNLLKEAIPEHVIRVTGNTVVDALMQVARKEWIPDPGMGLAQLPTEGTLILVTAHRRESHGKPLVRICQALQQIAQRGAGRIQLVYPVHPNPNIRQPVYRMLGGVPGVTLVPPVDYLTLVNLMKRSKLILTDSGGIQEEAPTLGTPVLILRDVTERPEAVEAGVAQLVGTDVERIVSATFRLLDDPRAYDAMARSVNPFGDGQAAERIVTAMLES